MSVFPISGPGLALGTSSSKKRSVGAERRAAPRVVPSRCPGRAGAVGGPPDPVPANGAAPLPALAASDFAMLRTKTASCAREDKNPTQANPIHRNGPGTPAARPLPSASPNPRPSLTFARSSAAGWGPSPERAARVRVRARAAPRRRLRLCPADAWACSAPEPCLGPLRRRAGPAHRRRFLFNAAAAVGRSSPSQKTRGCRFTFTFHESRPSLPQLLRLRLSLCPDGRPRSWPAAAVPRLPRSGERCSRLQFGREPGVGARRQEKRAGGVGRSGVRGDGCSPSQCGPAWRGGVRGCDIREGEHV